MALSASTVWDVRTGGSDTNGGGFVTDSGGTDYSQQDAAQLSVTDAVCTGNTTVTSATGGFTAAMVGSIMYLSSGPGWYQITARASTNSITIDRNGPNATGMTANVGGALATPGGLGLVWNAHGVAGQKSWIKSGIYTLSSASANVSGGTVYITNDLRFHIEGYETTRGDRGAKPVLTVAAQTGISLWKGDSSSSVHACQFINLGADGNGQSGIVGFDFISRHDCGYCLAENCATGFSGNGTGNYVFSCIARSCSTAGFSNLSADLCLADSCGVGFVGGTDNNFFGNIAYNSTGDGFTDTRRCRYTSCHSIGSGGDGFDINESSACRYCVAAYNGAYGYNGNSDAFALYSYEISNTSGPTSSVPYSDVTTLTADPYVDRLNGNFNINNTAGGGAVLRGATLTL